MTANEIRRRFLDYFARHGHRTVASSSLMPAGDPTLLFTNAGMNQFKDLFLGTETRDYARACSSQKCVRAGGKHNDLDEVGKTARHHTFFEMLGNFSFGDYFKEDAIRFAWDLLVNEFQMDPTRLWFTVFAGDDEVGADEEAEQLWQREGAHADRILRFSRKDNFWQMGETGPCGPCSEIHYYLGEHPEDPAWNKREYVNGAGDETVEIWNLVFMQYNRTQSGPAQFALTPLPAPSVDTGGGLERWAAVLQGVASTFETDLIRPIIDFTAELAGRSYAYDEREEHVAMRVIADHARSTAFLITDGILPSNEGRGYVLRKIMRRAMLHGRKIGFTKPFLHDVVEFVIGHMSDAFPELRQSHAGTARTVHGEEKRFETVLTSGLPRLEELMARTTQSNSTVLPGDEVFRLYDSLGVPVDFVEDLAVQRGFTIDRAQFDDAMDAQRERARSSSAFEIKQGPGFAYGTDAERRRIEAVPDQFEGYVSTRSDAATIVALFGADRHQVEALGPGDEGYVVLDRTAFYVESGGQVSDTGQLWTGDAPAADVDAMTRAVPGGARAHHIIAHQPLKAGIRLAAQVNVDARDATRRNHTATHLLQAALRRRLGTHVRQAGSLVTPHRLRFDFTHAQAVTADERRDLERAVNEEIYRNRPVDTEVRSTEDAIKSGAMALFGEKYGEKVRVVSILPGSVELCGGTHVHSTGEIGPFVIAEESGIAAGVRRIEALTGAGAVIHIQGREAALARTLAALGVSADAAPDAATKLHAEVRRLTRENSALKTKLAVGDTRSGDDDVVEVNGARFVVRRVTGLEKDALRGLSDSLRDRVKRGVVVLAAANDGKVQLLISVTKDLTDKIKAGQLVKDLAPIVGGAGGGRPDFAEAGGKDASKIDDLLARARELVTAALTRP